MIQIENLSFSYPNCDIFKNFNLNIEKGCGVILTAPSGRGKSTLAALIAGLLKPRSGSIKVAGQVVTKPSRKIWMINQENDLFPWLTAEKQIHFANPNVNAQRLLSDVELSCAPNCYPKELSGGMKKRLSLARALAVNPDVLILDEVFSSQDSKLKDTLVENLANIWQANATTVLIITHDPNALAALDFQNISI